MVGARVGGNVGNVGSISGNIGNAGSISVGNDATITGDDGSGNVAMSTLLKNARLDRFKCCTVPQLKAFCRVHILPTETSLFSNQKKGTVQEAESGVENLLFLAHSFRER